MIQIIQQNFLGRPTEIPEDDVFICESAFDENKNMIRKLGAEGLKKFNHSNQVTEDEIYFFRKPINPAKVNVETKLRKLMHIIHNYYFHS